VTPALRWAITIKARGFRGRSGGWSPQSVPGSPAGQKVGRVKHQSPRNEAAATPRMVKGCWFTWTTRPTTPGSSWELAVPIRVAEHDGGSAVGAMFRRRRERSGRDTVERGVRRSSSRLPPVPRSGMDPDLCQVPPEGCSRPPDLQSLRLRARRSRKSGYDWLADISVPRSICIRLPALGTCSGRRTSPFITLKDHGVGRERHGEGQKQQ